METNDVQIVRLMTRDLYTFTLLIAWTSEQVWWSLHSVVALTRNLGESQCALSSCDCACLIFAFPHSSPEKFRSKKCRCSLSHCFTCEGHLISSKEMALEGCALPSWHKWTWQWVEICGPGLSHSCFWWFPPWGFWTVGATKCLPLEVSFT